MAATGPMGLAKEHLRTALADALSCRAWLGATSQAEALRRIWLDGLPAPEDRRVHTLAELESLRPYAIVYQQPDEGFTLTTDAFDDHDTFVGSGRLVVMLEQNCPESYDDEPSGPANEAWGNTVDAIVQNLADLSGQAGYLAVRRLTFSGPYWTPPTRIASYGLAQTAFLNIDW